MSVIFNQVVAEAAEKLGMSVWQFKRAIFDEMDEQYDREDVQAYLDANDYEYTEDDVQEITWTYRDTRECSNDMWSNIEYAVMRHYRKKEGKE